MKKAGDLLAAFLDERLTETARGYSDLFSSWKTMAGDKIASHSRIKDLKRSILLVEADHPGWIQILQTKAPQIISAVRRCFPELDVRGVFFTLGKPKGEVPEEAESPEPEIPPEQEPVRENKGPEEGRTTNEVWEQIGDPDLKDSLKRLERSIEDREKSAARRTKRKK
ncbi:MAG: DUF721 domain-containing protein [Treponema sp.]|jgi:hypothetical protein|nr:DUF721 domain-containing protein [Treponema sp.]